MADVNIFVGTGVVPRDPEIEYRKDGALPVAKFSIGNNPSYKKDAKTNWIECVAFQKTAEYIGNYIHKGAQVLIVGEFTTGEYTPKDGAKRKTASVTIRTIKNIGGKAASNTDAIAAVAEDFASMGKVEEIDIAF